MDQNGNFNEGGKRGKKSTKGNFVACRTSPLKLGHKQNCGEIGLQQLEQRKHCSAFVPIEK